MKQPEEWIKDFSENVIGFLNGGGDKSIEIIKAIQQDAIASNSPQASVKSVANISNIHAQTASLNEQAEPSDAKERGDRFRARILVAVDKAGNWIALGGSDYGTDESLHENIFLDALCDGEQFFFVEANIPVISEPTIEGEIK